MFYHNFKQEESTKYDAQLLMKFEVFQNVG